MGNADKGCALVTKLAALLNYLDTIYSELMKSGKIDSAEFFLKHRNEIDRLQNSPGKLKDVIGDLTTCRAMAQYADFSLKEEELLDAVVSSSSDYLHNTP
jgi:hypothetical protein